MRCKFCANLSISHLVSLVKAESTVKVKAVEGYFPQHTFYQHHGSIKDVQTSADEGCDLCDLLVECLKGYADPSHIYAQTWIGPSCEPNESLLAAATRSPSSDIKIRLLPRGSTHLDSLKGAQTLDTLYVQIGPSIAHQPDNELEVSDEDASIDIPYELPILLMKISVPPSRYNTRTVSYKKIQYLTCSKLIDEDVLVDGYRIGSLQIDPVLGSERNRCIAKKWLHDCQNQHRNCLRKIIPKLPTRVIDVGSSEGTILVRLVCSDQRRAHYVALSHCWGGPIDTVLTTERVRSFEKRLPYDDLPPNFQDAITITRFLGIQYLWIDSLCIIQDSKRDWEIESKKMGLVYRDSTVTLSAMASKGSKHGILVNETEVNMASPAPIYLPVYPGNDERSNMVQIERAVVDEETLFRLDSYGPLCSRGWCLQESILPPRQLYYGKRQIYWRCPAGYLAADGSVHGNQVPENRFPNLSTVLHSEILAQSSQTEVLGNLSTRVILEEYYGLVERYSYRSLTFGSDKLPAFSGISQRVHEALPGNYLAGLWTCDIASGLLWCARWKSCAHVRLYRAPSWSWACTDEPIMFDQKKQRVLRNRLALDLVHEHVEYRDNSNPYGEIVSGRIVVRGPVLPLQRSRQIVQGNNWREKVGTASYDEELSSVDDQQALELTDFKNFSLTSDYVQIVNEDESPYLLSISASLSSDPRAHEVEIEIGEEKIVDEEEIKIDPDLISSDNHIALIVRVDEEDTHVGPRTRARGLILRQLDTLAEQGTGDFERIGMLEFSDFKIDQLQMWRIAEIGII
ncbi:Nn.00g101850.m01.CDS01 [Neocucurbitaria sp. VM-36]